MESGSIASVPARNARLSRYLSVRKAATRDKQDAPPLPDMRPYLDVKSQDKSPINRAPSRYRRPAASRHHDYPLPVETTSAPPPGKQAKPVADWPQPTPLAAASSKPINAATHPVVENFKATQRSPQLAHKTSRNVDTSESATQRTTRHRSKTISTPKEHRPLALRRSYDQAREEARLILEGEYDRLHRLKQQQEQAERERRKRAEAKQKAEQARVEEVIAKEETRIKEQGQGQQHQQEHSLLGVRKWTIGKESSNAAPPVFSSQSPPTSQRLQPVREIRGRNDSSGDRKPCTEYTSIDSHALPSDKDAERPTLKQRIRRHTHSRPREAHSPRSFDPSAGDGPPKTAVNGPAQAADAPVSAVNAGERRVEVRFDKSKISLPVTPSTTVKDLLNSASIIMSQPIDPRTSVLLETYYPLGLERPLRRYEHIRDVMNSWDSDTQNYLMIMPRSECAAVGLEQKDAPVEQPLHTTLNLYHSQKPGKWEKHWMIIKEDGQVTASVKENDSSATNAFHLSDFDVYMPTRKQTKKLRPPKKICFAIKSQQRSIMFESTENFVHFFATNDRAVADQWYNAVQAWRSWYLVNVLGEGTAVKSAADSAAVNSAVSKSQPIVPRHSTSHSRDSIPYQLGTFQPLLNFNMDTFVYGEKPESPKQSESKATSSPQRSTTLVDHARSRSSTNDKTTGLERRATTKRPTTSSQSRHHREESHHVPVAPSSTDAAFTGKGLLARAFSVKKARAEEGTADLVNTDNAFTGKGFLSHKMSSQKVGNENTNPGVIENTNDAFTGAGLLSLQRKMSTKKFANENLNPGVVENTNDAFTGAGLLSVQRSVTKKRSAASARPGQPLVDLNANSSYADGSLLKRVEGWEIATGQNLPTIDRSKGIEINAKTGEV